MGRAPCCDKNGLKKGPWTPEEDEKLIHYIQKHGYGNWRTLPNNAGLQRCGKSCRLRWTNYLRPDIKRGRFSPQEEETIIQLHGVLGNKWSAIAGRLPGRTDNEIKNYWNTHIRKRLLGMGIDPVTHAPRLDLMDLSALILGDSSSQMSFSRLLGLHEPELIVLATSLLSRDQQDLLLQNPTAVTDVGNNQIICPRNYQTDPTPAQGLTTPDNFQFDYFNWQLKQNPAGYWSIPSSSSTYYNSVTEDEREISNCSDMYLKHEINPEMNLDVNHFV